IMIGTKVALYGSIIVVALYVIMIAVAKLLKQDILVDKKIVSIVGLSIFIIGVLYAKSPSINRGMVENSYKSNAEKQEEKEEINEYTDENQNNNQNQEISKKQEMVEYIKENFIDAK